MEYNEGAGRCEAVFWNKNNFCGMNDGYSKKKFQAFSGWLDFSNQMIFFNSLEKSSNKANTGKNWVNILKYMGFGLKEVGSSWKASKEISHKFEKVGKSFNGDEFFEKPGILLWNSLEKKSLACRKASWALLIVHFYSRIRKENERLGFMRFESKSQENKSKSSKIKCKVSIEATPRASIFCW